MLSQRKLLTIKMSLMVAIASHKDTIKQRKRFIENSYSMDDNEVNVYLNANKICEGWIDDAKNALIEVNNMLNVEED
jgi:hypothetical protein